MGEKRGAGVVAGVSNGAFVVPAFEAGELLGEVLDELIAARGAQGWNEVPILVVDDGSTDQTAQVAQARDVILLQHEENRGKGAALQTALHWALESGLKEVVTLDADGQHPPREAAKLMAYEAPENSLVLGVRNLQAAGAPSANQKSNAFSNRVLSLFGGRQLLDTQCGLRRYPVVETLELGASAAGYAYEADLVLRAARAGLSIVHVDTDVIYPPEEQRLSHFDSVKDPTRIVFSVVWTTLTTPHHRPPRRWGRRVLVMLFGAWIVSSLI